MVVRGLFEIDTIRPYLAFSLCHNYFPPQLPIMWSHRQVGAKRSDVEQANSLAQQMSVRRRISRQIPTDMPGIEAQGDIQIALKTLGYRRTATQKMRHPNPSNASQGNFQTAGPINSNRIGVFLSPVVPLVESLSGESIFLRKAIGFGEGHQVLMPVQFPCNLWVANLSEIHCLDLEPGFARSPLLVHSVEMPIDPFSVVENLMS